MEVFPQLRILGSHALELDDMSSEDELAEVVTEAGGLDVIYSLDEPLILDEGISEAETIPGSPVLYEEDTVPIIEIVDSDSEVEFVEHSKVSQMLSMQEENECMKVEERFGHFLRVQAREQVVQDRLSAVFQAIASESTEQRRARRQSFRQQVHGSSVFEGK